MKNFLKKLALYRYLKYLRVIYAKLDLYLIEYFSNNGFLASFYYTFFSDRFYREHKSVLQGRLKYKRSLYEIDRSSILLRRNIHRLEKGIIMRPRRAVFAEGYIQETVDCLQRCLNAEDMCQEELRWASDVLEQYFSIVSDTPRIAKARACYQNAADAADDPVKLTESHRVPYPKAQLPAAGISPEQLRALFQQRRSVRWFQQKPVPEKSIHQAVEMASLAPSACNRQPFEFYVVNESTQAQKVASTAMGTVGFSHNLPCIIVVLGELGAYPNERDRHVIYIDASLASMQLMLAFESLGLSSCPINWPDIESNEKRLASLLALPHSKRPVMLIAVGYADDEGLIPYSQKKSARLLIKELAA